MAVLRLLIAIVFILKKNKIDLLSIRTSPWLKLTIIWSQLSHFCLRAWCFTLESCRQTHIAWCPRSCSKAWRWSQCCLWSSSGWLGQGPPLSPPPPSPRCSSDQSCWPRCHPRGWIGCNHLRKYPSLKRSFLSTDPWALALKSDEFT